MNKSKMKSKSAISFKEFQHIANEVLEIGNDWGFYVDIETNHKLIDFNYFNYIKKPIFHKNHTTINIINEIDEENFKENTSSREKNRNVNKHENKDNKNEKIIIQKSFNYLCNFMKMYLIKYTCPIITTFILSYYIFKIK